MLLIRIVSTIFIFFLLALPVKAYNVPQPNNKFGIHILSPDELPKAVKLVNNNGDWGYITIPIQSYDHDLAKWQKFMDDAKKLHVIPIIRIATYPEGQNWTKPTVFDTVDWPNFLDSLDWPTQDRLVILYNETNHSQEWGGEISPEEYALHINDLIDRFKLTDTNFTILNGALDLAASNTKETIDAYTYFKRMNVQVPGIFKKFDGWASHSYPQPEFSGSPDQTGRKSILGYKDELSFLDSQFGIKNLPVFITETGWQGSSLSPKTLAEYYTKAYTEKWTDPNVVAVTPFLLSAGTGVFQKFSFLSPGGEELEQYKKIASLPKEKGNPLIHEISPILGASSSAVENKQPLQSKAQEQTIISLDNAKNFLRWLSHF